MKQMFEVDVQVLFPKNNICNHKSMFESRWLMKASQETPVIHSNEYGYMPPIINQTTA